MRFFLFQSMNIEQFYPLYLAYPLIITDSRSVMPGSIFFGLRGGSFNGNDFAREALHKGAHYAVVDDPRVAGTDQRCILVENSLEFMQSLARFHRRKLNIPVLAITGTNGKTTTKELVASVLSHAYKVHYTKGNLNNHIGVPQTLLSMPDDTEMAVIEMGANHPGEIDFLCRIAEPTHGLVTNVGKAHLEGFGSLEGVIRTKTEMFRYISEKGGMIFLNSGQEQLVREASKLPCRTITYGAKDIDNCRGMITGTGPTLSLRVRTSSSPQNDAGWVQISTRLFGEYNLDNVLAATCIGRQFGIDLLAVKERIENYQPGNNRSEIRQSGNHTLILDYYNANPASMRLAIENLSKTTTGPKVAILGDMFELGNYAAEEHRAVASQADEAGLAQVFLIGPEFCRFTSRYPRLKFFQGTVDFAAYLDKHPLPASTILLKGSRGMKLENLLPYL